MKKHWIWILLMLTLLLTACGTGSAEPTPYESVSPEAAKRWMDREPNCVILDVRTEAEYAEAHIPGAVLIPHDAIAAVAEAELPDKERLILVYCRSGRRSKLAAEALVALGYTNVKEFGGILDWPYETE